MSAIKPSKSNSFHNKFFENLMNRKSVDNSENTTHTPVKAVIGGHEVFDEKAQLSNAQFGDVIMIIELYNGYLKLYEKIMDHESIAEDIKLSKIEYDKFIDMLYNTNDEANKKYLFSIIETLIKIILNNDKMNGSRKILDHVKLNKFNLQDITRVLLQENFCYDYDELFKDLVINKDNEEQVNYEDDDDDLSSEHGSENPKDGVDKQKEKEERKITFVDLFLNRTFKVCVKKLNLKLNI